MAVARFSADVDVNLAREIGRHRRRVQRAVVEQNNHRLVLRVRTGDGILVRQAAEARQLPGLARVRARDDSRPGAAVGDFFSVEQNPVARAALTGEESVLIGQVCGAEPLPLRRARRILMRGLVPKKHIDGRLGEILAF